MLAGRQVSKRVSSCSLEALIHCDRDCLTVSAIGLRLPRASGVLAGHARLDRFPHGGMRCRDEHECNAQ